MQCSKFLLQTRCMSSHIYNLFWRNIFKYIERYIVYWIIPKESNSYLREESAPEQQLIVQCFICVNKNLVRCLFSRFLDDTDEKSSFKRPYHILITIRSENTPVSPVVVTFKLFPVRWSRDIRRSSSRCLKCQNLKRGNPGRKNRCLKKKKRCTEVITVFIFDNLRARSMENIFSHNESRRSLSNSDSPSSRGTRQRRKMYIFSDRAFDVSPRHPMKSSRGRRGGREGNAYAYSRWISLTCRRSTCTRSRCDREDATASWRSRATTCENKR